MKITISKSAKRALSLVLAFAMLLGSLFVANVGVNISANAETIDYSTKRIEYWDGSNAGKFDNFEKDGDTYIINTAAELYYVCARAGATATALKDFKVDPEIYAFILQPKAVVDKMGGPEAFLNASSAEETRELFEETAVEKAVTLTNWQASGVFDGDFDGSGVPICGLYANAYEANISNAALFGAIDGGGSYATNRTDRDIEIDSKGITLQNIVINGGYFKSNHRIGVIAGTSWYSTSTSTLGVDGCVNLKSSVITNCYLWGQNLKKDGSLQGVTETNAVPTSKDNHKNECGIIGGSCNNDPFKVSNCLFYGNDSLYKYYSDANTCTHTEKFHGLFAQNTSKKAKQVVDGVETWPSTTGVWGAISDSVVLDAKVYGFENATDYYTDVYTNVTPQFTAYDITSIIDHETTKGATGIKWMPDLDWETQAWYAVDGKYPSPIKPDGWTANPSTDGMTWFEGGDGTAANPYKIRTADQLKYMFDNDASDWEEDTQYHYKVAEGVDAIYINKATTHDEAIALGQSGSYYNWSTAKAFNGHFDGKGVTIYGMISTGTNPGFVTEFGVMAVIENVNFLGAYVKGSRAAVVTTNASSWSTTPDPLQLKSYITSVTVRESYIESTGTSGTGAGNATAAGILSVGTPDHVIVKNCLYDGGSCTLKDGDAENGANIHSSKAGIASFYGSGSSTAENATAQTGGNSNEVEVIDCVSINEYPVSLDSDVWYYRYQGDCPHSGFKFENTYGVFEIDGTYPTFFEEYYGKFVGCAHIDTQDQYAVTDMPTLNWGAWKLTTLDDGRVIPMPKTSDDVVESFSRQIANQNGGKGANGTGAFPTGTYGMYHTLTGSGTKDDPYLIGTAFELARAIASGGVAVGHPLYYKLTQDVDGEGANWITQDTIGLEYTYVPFEGVLDGDGHTVYNVNIGDITSAGLIPVLNGGTVKNIHLRNSTVASFDKAGAIVGTVISGTIENCSAEYCEIVKDGVNGGLYDGETPTITNSYYYTSPSDYKYYDANGAMDGMPTPDYTGANADTAVWYKGKENPRLVCRAKAMPEVDVAGDEFDEYTTSDLTTLQNYLLKVDVEKYKNIYGDASRNGKINMSDLAIVARHIAGSYDKLADGFWRNAELGNVVIYYGENDNYDAARKVELYLESVTGQDIKKVVVNGDGNVSWGNGTGGTYVHDGNILIMNDSTFVADKTADGGFYDFANEETKAECTAKYGTADQYALDGKMQIVVGDLPNTEFASGYTTESNKYAVTYDKTSGSVWIKGANFTAVEQAVIEFIKGSDPDKADSVYDCEEKTLVGEKLPVPLDINNDGTVDATYYYAWGDEFSGDNIDTSVWYNNKMNTETSNNAAKANEEDKNHAYYDVETAGLDDLAQLYVVEDGKLSIKRGVRKGAVDETKAAALGYAILDNHTSGTTTVFNDSIEDDDYYANAGSINTQKSLLFKQGYLEMKGSLPSDGHAFASWWMYGHKGNNNYGYSQTLFDKVFKLNNRAAYSSDADYEAYGYDGVTDTLDSTNLKTFKYQVPSSSFEIDIWELMQHVSRLGTNVVTGRSSDTLTNYRDGYYYTGYASGSNNAGVNLRTSRTTGIFDYEVSLNIHKYYDVGAGDNSVNIIDWSDPGNPLGSITYSEITSDANKAGWQYSTSAGEHVFGVSKTQYTYQQAYQTGNYHKGGFLNMQTYYEYALKDVYGEYDSYTYDESLQKMLTANRRYGFYWSTADDGSNGGKANDGIADSFNFTTYIYDANGDGDESDVITIPCTTAMTYNEDTQTNAMLISDAKTANQYMYYIFDNIFYSSNNYVDSDGDGCSDTFDMIDGGEGKTSLDIDYVRVYQLDGKRDIITSETENFNNGNHFGY